MVNNMKLRHESQLAETLLETGKHITSAEASRFGRILFINYIIFDTILHFRWLQPGKSQWSRLTDHLSL
jgi:hypothetical protein